MADNFSTASITLQNLAKSFGHIKAVDDVDLDVAAGTLICLLGPSGCGKTTTLRMIAGFEEPTRGAIFIGNQNVTDVPPYGRPTAMVFQSYALFPHMSIYDNIAYGLRARRLPRSEIDQRVQEVVGLMELQGQEKKSPPQLSGGQQQRVALARALVVRPKVLLFDEPLSNLDAQLRVRMRSEIRALQRKLAITSVYVTHDQEEAFSIADKVAIMNSGRMIQLGTPLELYQEPADRFVAEFVGLSNIVPVEVVETNAEGAVIRVFGQTIQSRRPPRTADKRVAAVLRPEALSLTTDAEVGVSACVLTLAYIGPVARYTVAVNGGPVLAVDLYNPSPSQLFAEGTPVQVQLPAEVPALLG
jgi:iron(III) transport system ATP-binding protein